MLGSGEVLEGQRLVYNIYATDYKILCITIGLPGMSVASWCNLFFSESKACLSIVYITGWDPNVQCVVCPVNCEITVNRLFFCH